ncbi:hypothetical protein D3C84_580040 [compost metagenome]
MVGQFQLIGDKHVFNRWERQHAGGDFGEVGGVIVGHQRFFLVGSHGLSTLGINGCLGKRPAWRSGDI